MNPSSLTKPKMLLEESQNFLLMKNSLRERISYPSQVLGPGLGGRYSRDSSDFSSPLGCALLSQQGLSPCGFAPLELTPVTSVMSRTLDDQEWLSAQPSSDFQIVPSPGSAQRLGGFQKMHLLYWS